jgi:platelet-activating factor acetylhydrolase IB subunit alpha
LTIKLWNFDSLSCIRTLSGHEHTISCIEFTPNGDFLVSASRDKSIKVWEVNTGFAKKTFTGHNEWVRSISLNAEGKINS